MGIDIKHRKIKPLLANLLRIKIGNYLQTDDFDHLVLEHDMDKYWGLAKEQIRGRRNTGAVIDLTPFRSWDYENAFQRLLDALWRGNNPPFYHLVEITLTGYIRRNTDKTDLTKVLKSLAQLGMPKPQVERLKRAQKTKRDSDRAAVAESRLELKGSVVKPDDRLCFVIMPFDEEFDAVYQDIIKPVTEGLKLRCLRADEIFTSTSIIEDIQPHIRKARFLIADLTHRNPNVFYELGFAHALDKDVILLTQDLKKDVPFDLQHRRITAYRDRLSGPAEVKAKL